MPKIFSTGGQQNNPITWTYKCEYLDGGVDLHHSASDTLVISNASIALAMGEEKGALNSLLKFPGMTRDIAQKLIDAGKKGEMLVYEYTHEGKTNTNFRPSSLTKEDQAWGQYMDPEGWARSQLRRR